MNLRYGKYKIQNHAFTWFGAVVLCAGGLLCLLAEIGSKIYPVCAIFLSAAMIWPTYARYREWFSIAENHITVKKGRQVSEIPIPARPIIVISEACTESPFHASSQVSLELGTNILADRYVVSILKDMPLADALERLHRGYVKRYTNVTIENAFHWRVVYSFVCEPEILGQLLKDRDCLVIVPESLFPIYENVIMEHEKAGLYIDRGYGCPGK